MRLVRREGAGQFKTINFDEEPLLDWNVERVELSVGYFEGDDVLAYMNETPEIRKIVASALKDVYRYTGPFTFSLDIPF